MSRAIKGFTSKAALFSDKELPNFNSKFVNCVQDEDAAKIVCRCKFATRR